jgi:hypothetical protein
MMSLNAFADAHPCRANTVLRGFKESDFKDSGFKDRGFRGRGFKDGGFKDRGFRDGFASVWFIPMLFLLIEF